MRPVAGYQPQYPVWQSALRPRLRQAIEQRHPETHIPINRLGHKVQGHVGPLAPIVVIVRALVHVHDLQDIPINPVQDESQTEKQKFTQRGGKARALKLSPERRKGIAKNGASARWGAGITK